MYENIGNIISGLSWQPEAQIFCVYHKKVSGITKVPEITLFSSSRLVERAILPILYFIETCIYV